MTWANDEAKTASFGDARLDARMDKVLEGLAEKPGASIPQAMGDWAETLAAYRFFRQRQGRFREGAETPPRRDAGADKETARGAAAAGHLGLHPRRQKGPEGDGHIEEHGEGRDFPSSRNRDYARESASWHCVCSSKCGSGRRKAAARNGRASRGERSRRRCMPPPYASERPLEAVSNGREDVRVVFELPEKRAGIFSQKNVRPGARVILSLYLYRTPGRRYASRSLGE